MWGQVDAVEAARERGLINSLLEALKYQNPEAMNDEQFSALQDAACGALLNMWCGSGPFAPDFHRMRASTSTLLRRSPCNFQSEDQTELTANWSDLTWVDD
eukprot:COSAG02_NODE_1100_length_14582_cov_130.690672_7_plen_101_part_00